MKFWLNLIMLMAVIVVNALANLIPINGMESGEISDRLNVLFTPAGYVFSIWSLIYLLLLIWVFRQWPEHRRELGVYVHSHYLFWLSCLLNISWILLWHYQFFGATVIVMVILLLTLIILYKKIQRSALSFFDQLPFSIYLAWVSVATIANISYYLVEINWAGLGLAQQTWTIGLLLLAGGLATWFRYAQRDVFFPLVFVWALVGIGVNNQDHAQVVSTLAYVLAGTVVILILLVRKKNTHIFK
ncbi:TspO/MBR family protein [Amphibacillus marinus]|uniref:TspO/MBR family protein n=1 Tax=Amphibacillus marinus TaxID=872970 RepID=A0A1H8MDQ9_9BACI|nr:TspO/MBR family protein [Amphibacillus marinus]SEO15463.1 TspO/MBR family protein [Amphibacillus marinus]